MTYNWWSDISEDGTAIDRGLKILKFTSAFEYDRAITIEESSPTTFQEFTIIADIKTLNMLDDIAAYIVARSLLYNNDLHTFQLPKHLNKPVSNFHET